MTVTDQDHSLLRSRRVSSAPHRVPSIAARIGTMDQSRVGGFLLLLSTVAAIIWANASTATYQTLWQTAVTISLGDATMEFTFHSFVNNVLMAVFFFTLGLEVRREFAIGELTSWSRALVPVTAAAATLVVPPLLFVMIAHSSGNVHAWGTVIAADTAFVVSALALVGPRTPGRLRVFLLALAVVNDIGALSIIALVYTDSFALLPLLVAAIALAGVYVTRFMPVGRGPVYVLLSIVVWFAFFFSGLHPTLAGVAIALLIPVYRPRRTDVEYALALAHNFRQSPDSDYARAAVTSLRESISINVRLQAAYAPLVAYVILPVFALANAGVVLSPQILAGAVHSSVTWGVFVGLVAGQFIAVFGSAALLHRMRIGKFGPGLTLDRILGGAALCGMGFTISLFIIDLAIEDESIQNDARVGVLAATAVAFALATIIFRASDSLRPHEEPGLTLARPVDPARDHMLGTHGARYTIVEYGDFQCEFCLRASGSILEVREILGDRVCYVWRHAPLTQIHPLALATAEASEAAARQGAFFDFARKVFDDQDHQQPDDILRIAQDLHLDLEQFENDLIAADVVGRVRDDILDAETMDIRAVPTLFINGTRYSGHYDTRSLLRALTRLDGPDRPAS